MKSETWIFVICTFFFLLFAPAYWFVTGDLWSFREHNPACAAQLTALCGFRHAQVKIFVNAHDVDGALAIRNGGTRYTRAYRCNADLHGRNTNLLRIDTNGKLVLFGVTDAGFVALARNEAQRARVSLHALLIQDSDEENARGEAGGEGRAASRANRAATGADDGAAVSNAGGSPPIFEDPEIDKAAA